MAFDIGCVEIMERIEKILASIPPKFLLDHYFNVLDLISWRGFVEQEEKEDFTILSLREKLSREAQRYQNINPSYSRRCSRSLTIVEETVNELVGVGLLSKDGEIFRKTNYLSQFYYLLKQRVRKSLRRYVAWAILYLHNQKKLTSFSTVELVALLSYRDEDYINEMPYLVKWKENGWSKLLEKSGNEWKLLEEPYAPLSPILLTDIDGRLSDAIFELSKTKTKFHTEEVIKKLHELEQRSVEKILKSAGLKFENEKWQINAEILGSMKKLLKAEARAWPVLGILVFKNPYFKLQSRNMYVDLPNTTIGDFLVELERICQQHKDDEEKMYEEAKKLATTFNQSLEKHLGKWLLFSIRKQFFGSKPFGVQIKIDWRQFHSFLESFPKREIPLRDKYSYLLNCRAPSLKLVLRGDLERVQNEVKEVCAKDIEEIRQNLENLISRINKAKDYLFKIASYRRTIFIEPSTLEYFPEMISTLYALILLVRNGTIPACYREMRKVLENLSWVIFDDVLLYRTTLRKREHIEKLLIPSYRSVSKEWYDWASQEKLMLRNLRELESKIKNLTEMLYTHGESEGCCWDKKETQEILFKRISYPLFLLLTGRDIQVPKKLEEIIPQYEVEVLKSLAVEDLKNVLKDLKRTQLSKSEEVVVERVINSLIGKASKIVPLYPSNEFVLGFVSKIFSINLLELYKEYSQFVHSYFTSWHIFPFSSVLEFKIFKHELSIFIKTLSQLIDSYLNELF